MVGENMRILLLIFISFFTFGDNHKLSTDLSDCKGKIANYYVAKLTGSADGWLKAARMHQKFYKDRGSDIVVAPMMQYRRDSEGNVSEKLYRLSTMVIGSQESWAKWQEMRENRSEAEAKKAQAEYDAYVGMYNKNNELTVQRRLCIY